MAGRHDFGVGKAAAGIFGDQGVNLVVAHQLFLVLHAKRAARQDEAVSLGKRPLRRINAADDVQIVRIVGKRCELLAANGKKNMVVTFGYPGGLLHVVDIDPLVVVFRSPGRSVQGDERNTGRPGCFGCGYADFFRKWMGGVDHKINFVIHEPARQTRWSAETANADFSEGELRFLHPPGQRTGHSPAALQ